MDCQKSLSSAKPFPLLIRLLFQVFQQDAAHLLDGLRVILG